MVRKMLKRMIDTSRFLEVRYLGGILKLIIDIVDIV